MTEPYGPFPPDAPATGLPADLFTGPEFGDCGPADTQWQLAVRIRGHWTVCGLSPSSAAALREGLRQLALGGELDFSVDRNGRTGYTVRYARLRPGAASLRVTEAIPGPEVAA